MFLKRQVPIAIVFVIGVLTLFGWFIKQETIESFVNDDATQWYDIIASFAIILGALNLLKLQGLKVFNKKKDWQYSTLAIIGFLFAIFCGFFFRGTEDTWGAHLLSTTSLFNWMFKYIYTPLGATMFALLAFFVASASYRAFRIRNFEATLLLVSGIILMLGRVPIGSKISSWFVLYILVLGIGIVINSIVRSKTILFAWIGLGLLGVTIAGFLTGWPIDKPSFLFLPTLQEWIYLVPNIAGARALMIGIALGMIGTSLRVILGIEK